MGLFIQESPQKTWSWHHLFGSIYSHSTPHPSILAMSDNKLQHCRRVLQRALGSSGLLICVVTELFLKPSFAQLSSAPNPPGRTCVSCFYTARCPLSPHWPHILYLRSTIFHQQQLDCEWEWEGMCRKALVSCFVWRYSPRVS